MNNHDEATVTRVRPRTSESLSIRVPTDVLAALRSVAERRDMELEALVRLYIGVGLRQDLAQHFSEQVIETTEVVLREHMASEAEVSAILAEIRAATRRPA